MDSYQKTAMEIKSNFLANMSHDIRTPLTGIIGMAEAIVSGAENDKTKEYASDIANAGFRLLNLLNEILELTRFDLDNLASQKSLVNVERIINEIIELFSPAVQQKGLNINFKHDKNIPAKLLGNRLLIHRVLLNLISNALKFTSEGSIKISSRFISKDVDQIKLQVSIQDTGIGIPADKYEEIFQAFKRLNTFSSNVKGVGLGLNIVKQYLDMIGGQIHVESEPDKGSLFVCTIPLELIPADYTAQLEQDNYIFDDYDRKVFQAINDNSQFENNTESKHLDNSTHLKILLVEDDMLAQKMTKICLQDLQCHVDLASSGQEAIAHYTNKHYDILFLDIGLPDLDGFAVAEKIRVLEKACQRKPVKIIALTAHVDDDGKKRCIDAGMNSVLFKPLQSAQAKFIIDEYYAQHA